ncbi:hypothetical protein [Nonomuraea longispora]|uniref:hypothetical protein n=1 Tax=Nonomuraea longispora TaxID=1848320 RepID=UPI001FE75670|nr:hypothetical protein [Nonomuraea longispora]
MSRGLARRGLRVLGVDASAGMAGVAAGHSRQVTGESVSRRKRRRAKLWLSPTPWRSSWRNHRSRKSAKLPRTR